MKAIRVHHPGSPEVMTLEEIAQPEPGDGQARVRIEAIGVNFIDVNQRLGAYGDALPFIPGREAAGVVDAIGPGVLEVAIGDRVASVMVQGSYAEYAVVPAHRLVPLPDDISAQQAAAVLLQGLTAHYLTHSTFPLEKGQVALVHAAAGGVGLLLVQLAKRRGAHVIGTVSTEEKARAAKAAGADDVILYEDTDFVVETKRLTNGLGVDVVYDSVGLKTFDKSLNCLKPCGYMVLLGQSSGRVTPVDPQLLNTRGSLFLTRPGLMHHIRDRTELLHRASDLFRWIRAGELNLSINAILPLAQCAESHRRMQSRESKGKLLLV